MTRPGDSMTELTAEKILSVDADGMADFIQQRAATRTLSRLIKTLNSDLIHGDERARETAAAALKHLGFCDQPDC